MMRFLLLCFLVINSMGSYGQTSLREIQLNKGKFNVGYKHYVAIDSSRTYNIHDKFDNQYINRPIPISVWYPANIEKDKSRPLVVLDYLQILKKEKEWEHLPNYFLLDWFAELGNTPENNAHLTESSNAFFDADVIKKKFPVIVYSPSYQASSVENFVMCEYLASNGFIVLASPSRGTESKWLEGGTVKDMETQSRDVDFLIKEAQKFQNTDVEKIALLGFSFGGLSNMLTAMKNKHVKAIASLDGTERYNYSVLQKSSYFNLRKLTIPYIHFAQKEIPDNILKSDNLPAEINFQFQLYDSLSYNDVYRYKFHNLTHSHFSSLGVLFAARDERQDKSDDLIMESYKLLAKHTLQFLKATLKNDPFAINFMTNEPTLNGVVDMTLSKEIKSNTFQKFTYKDFNDIAFKQNYEDLISLYSHLVLSNPELELQEGMLNTLGLRLTFDPNSTDQGINVLLLAVHLYPESSNLYDSLAECYLYRKDFENAKLNFNKSLDLNPENQNAIERLKQL